MYVKQMTTGKIFTGNEPDVFENFFELKDIKELSEDHVLDLEILNYLRDQNTDSSMLNLYRNIKKLFIKYNSILASVERFSFTNLIVAQGDLTRILWRHDCPIRYVIYFF